MESLNLKIGDLIQLNKKAEKWTNGLIFTVDSVRVWGVICHADLKEGQTYYRAIWDEVERET